MSKFRATLRAPVTSKVLPGDFTLEATFTNTSAKPAQMNLAQASHPSLVLEVRDSRDQRVLLPPPSVPDEKELGPGEEIAAGQSVTLNYAGFLDMNLGPGTYRVRYASPHPALGGSKEDPLVSDWLEFSVRKATDVAPPTEPLKSLGPAGEVLVQRRPIFFIGWLLDFFHWLLCLLHRLFGRRCDRILTREVDEQRTETISDAPAGAEAWNGTYNWRARFHVRLDEADCRVTVTVRVRLNGAITQAQRDAWEQAIENAWGNRFKFCCRCCCCPNGYTIVTDLQFVDSGEHQVVTVGNSTISMNNWGQNDTTDVRHEFGHMLGALDEYFTVNGVNYGAARQATGNIMNNTINDPAAHHYDVIRAAVQDLLGTSCRTIPVIQNC